MAKLFWNSGSVRGAEAAQLDPASYRDVLQRLGEAIGVELSLLPEQERAGGDVSFAPVRNGGRRCGWGVSTPETDQRSAAVAKLAADLVGRLFTSDQDIASL
jgi:hypothetical protein